MKQTAEESRPLGSRMTMHCCNVSEKCCRNSESVSLLEVFTDHTEQNCMRRLKGEEVQTV